MTDGHDPAHAPPIGTSSALVVRARAAAVTAEDPFGAGDPLVVARLVRRALAAAGRKAFEVTELVAVADVPPDDEALRRFVRRALGPRGAAVEVRAGRAVGIDQAARESSAIEQLADGVPDTATALIVLVCLGPGGLASVSCLTAATVGRS
jgi:hypothetical protein